MKLPTEYESRMRSLLGDDAEAYFAALDAEPTRAMRINRTKLTGDLPDTDGVTLSPSGIPDVFLFDGPAGGKNPLHHAGAYYIQELSAMLPVLSAPIQKGWRVLDLCAAPGGKTGQLASAVGEDGFVVTNEYSSKRARVLLGNVERMGHRNCAVYNSTPDRLCPAFAGAFDLVLVDAPCSGEGMFRKEPDAIQDWSPENSSGCAVRQLEIMRSAAAAVKPGGYLLYSTCTFSPAEDEELIAAFLREDPRFSLVPLDPPNGAGELMCGISADGYPTELCRRAYPHKVSGEGQFFGLMRRDESPIIGVAEKKQKKGKAPAPSGIRALSKSEKGAADAFLSEFLESYDELSLCVLGGDIFICSDANIPADGLLACGVRLGNLAKDGRLVPHHHFFSAYGDMAKLKLELAPNSPLLEKYLHGEGFPAEGAGIDDSGWGVITVCGCAVGGFRIAGGYLKNHYPKGLRN